MIAPSGCARPTNARLGDARPEDTAKQLDAIVRRREEALVEERERDAVARAVDHHVGVHARPVGELHPVGAELRDVRPRRDRAVADAVEDPPGHGRVRSAEPVVGPRQAVALGPAGVQADHRLRDARAEPVRHVRDRADLVARLSEEVLRHDPGAATRGEVRRGGDVARLDGDVHRAVAHPQHDDVLARQERVVAVVVGVDLDALEGVGAGERRLGPAPVPVVAVGDDEHVVLVRPRRGHPSAASCRRRAAVRGGSLVSKRMRSRKPNWSTYASKYAAICVWWGKSGSERGIGKSENCIRSREVLMCRSR